jgi:hypothetical protein
MTHRLRITFENEPKRNGSTTACPPSLPAAMQTLDEMVGAALTRPSPTTITITVTPDRLDAADDRPRTA